MYVRHARGITLDDVRLDVAGADLRPALVCDDVEDIELSGFRAEGNADADALIRLRDTRGAFVHGSRPLTPVKVFIQTDGSPDVLLEGNDLRKAGQALIEQCNPGHEWAGLIRLMPDRSESGG
jgi:hypothetical protein